MLSARPMDHECRYSRGMLRYIQPVEFLLTLLAGSIAGSRSLSNRLIFDRIESVSSRLGAPDVRVITNHPYQGCITQMARNLTDAEEPFVVVFQKSYPGQVGRFWPTRGVSSLLEHSTRQRAA